MDRTDEYLKRAEEAEHRAEGMVGLMRDQFLDIAKQWRQLARQAGELRAGRRHKSRDD